LWGGSSIAPSPVFEVKRYERYIVKPKSAMPQVPLLYVFYKGGQGGSFQDVSQLRVQGLAKTENYLGGN
jgi:hypothetical protein